MENDQLIATEQFCTYYNVSTDFVDSLEDFGLIETVFIQKIQYLHVTQLHRIERMVRLHVDLDINPEGLQAVSTLLDRIETMQHEIISLRNRLTFYEG